MGKDLVAIAATLGRTVPGNGLLVTTSEAFSFLARAGKIPADAGRCHIITDETDETQTEDSFPFEVFGENLALALRVCELAGIPREIALSGMKASAPDAGNLTVQEHIVGNRRIRVVDATAANDPDSTQIIWRRYVENHSPVAGILLHSRMDRRIRTIGLCDLFGKLHAGPYFLTGDMVFAERQLKKAGVAAERIVRVPEATLSAVLTQVSKSMTGLEGTLFAAGNRKGLEM